mgnify:CR=1 FL=1
MTYLLFVLGFVVLILGADWLVDAATSLGRRAHMSPLIIGLTIVAFGTSLPELIINIFACAKGSSGLAIGNIVGSNIMNLLLILGVSAIIYPINVSNVTIRRDIPAGFLATAILIIVANISIFGSSNTISWGESIILLAMAVVYMWITVFKGKENNLEGEMATQQEVMSWGKTILLLVLGIGGLYAGGELVSTNAQVIARSWGMSEAMIGLTIVAVATSLPELITSIVAAAKKNSDMAIGNVLGSNIINILVVLGISGLIIPLEFDPKMNVNLYILFFSNLLLLLFVYAGKGRKISRVEGIMFVLAFVGFMVYTVVG